MIFTFNGRPKQLRTFGGFPDISISKVIQLKRDNVPTGILGMQIDYDDDTKLYNLCFAVKESVFDEYEVIAEVTLKKCDDKIATKRAVCSTPCIMPSGTTRKRGRTAHP